LAASGERNLSAAPRSFRIAVCAGVFLISAASLALEVLLTRIFSVMMWHHYAFLVVSVAMFGFGASAALLAAAHGAGGQAGSPPPQPAPHPLPAWSRYYPLGWRLAQAVRAGARRLVQWASRSLARLDRADTSSLLWGSALGFAVSVPLSLLALCHLPFMPGRGDVMGAAGWPAGAAFYLAAALPFVFVGVTITTALTRSRSLVGTVYAADLLGAGGGGVLGMMLLRPLGGPGAVGAVGVLGGLAAVAFALPSRARAARWWALAALPVLVLAAAGVRSVEVPLRTEKARTMYPGYSLTPTRLLLSAWNPLSRVDVISPADVDIGPGGRALPHELQVYIDGKALTEIPHNEPGVDLGWLTGRPPNLPYLVGGRDSVLIIGAGGGIDVLSALQAGAERVTAVEINPLITDLVLNRYAWFAGGLYDRPEVRVVVGEGRHFASRTPERYDMVQLSLVDTWAAAASGAYSLSESYLYTVEGFEAYLTRLKPGGMVGITRWMGDLDAEMLRVCSVAMAALQRQGVRDVSKCFIVVEQGIQGTALVKREPFAPEEIAAASEAAGKHGWNLLHPHPQAGGFEERAAAFRGLLASGGSEAFYSRQVYDVRPVTDDKPFFFDLANQLSPRPAWKPLSLLVGQRDSKGRAALRATFRVAAVLSAAFVLAPLAIYRRRGVRAPGWSAWLGYFAALGLGFMSIEMLLMQRLVLFLGHPVYAVTVVLSVLLITSGLGSLTTGSVRRPRAALTAGVLVLLIWIAVHYALWDGIVAAGQGWSLAARLALSVALIVPGGFLLGMPLPLGLRTTPERVAPWAWGVNLCFSVVGSIVAVFIAMEYGFRSELLVAGAAYAAAALLFLVGTSRSTTPA